MVWFKVDDKLHSHPKAARASLAAMGLWALAGSWCGDHTTDGRVPLHMIPSLSRGAIELADELVVAGLWVRVKDGYRFHEWLKDSDGTKRNPSKKEVEESRQKKAAAGKKGGLASGKTRSKREANASAHASPTVEPPTRPDPPPSNEGGEGDARSTPPGEASATLDRGASPVDWRQQKAFGVPPDPEIAETVHRGAAAAKAEIRKPKLHVVRSDRDALAELDSAVAEMTKPAVPDG